MNLVIRESSNGLNLAIRQQGQARFYPASTAPASRVAVYEHNVDELPSAARLVGIFVPGQSGNIPYNPARDVSKVLRAVSFSASGTPNVSHLADAPSVVVNFNRETDASAVMQIGASTNTLIQLSITGYSDFAVARRVRIADDAAMTTGLRTVYTTAPLAAVFDLMRAATSGAQTVYVRVSHSGAGVAGPWGPESAAAAFTFANSGGTGGTTGGGNYYHKDEYEL